MRLCPVCEGYTSSSRKLCAACDVPLLETTEVSWSERKGENTVTNPWIGQIIGGKYRITGVLGKGGMGTVYRSEHVLSLSPFALKVLQPRFAGKSQFKDNLIAEARKTARVSGKHVAQIHDVGETPEGSVYIAMELVSGQTLSEYLARHERMPPALVCELLMQLCMALEEASAAGVVHRDIAPKNIILGGSQTEPQIKVLDFGIARFVAVERENTLVAKDENDENQVTEGWINPPYTAPEILQGESGDVRSDLYSSGVLAFKALCGKDPHGGASLEERVDAVLSQDPIPLEVPRRTPALLVKIIHRLMDKEPARRPQSPAQVRAELMTIDEPHSKTLRVLAFVILVLGMVLLSASFVYEPDASLASLPRSILLFPTRPDQSVAHQALKIEDLYQQSFECRGLASAELTIVCYTREGTPEYTVEGRIDRGHLEFDKEQDPSWKQFLDAIKNVGGKMQLVFHQDRQTLAFAKIFLDIGPPSFNDALSLTTSTSGADQDLLMLDTVLEGEVYDDDERVTLRCQLLDSKARLVAEFSQSVKVGQKFSFPLGKLWKGKPGTELGRSGIVKLIATDPAGREFSSPLSVHMVDLAIPAITDARTHRRDNLLDTSGEEADISLSLSPPLTRNDIDKVRVTAYLPDARPRELESEMPGGSDEDRSELIVRFRLPDVGNNAETVALKFQLVDQAGNQSNAFSKTFKLQHLDLSPSFAKGNDNGDSVTALYSFVPGDKDMHLHLGKGGFLLAYRCNPDFRPLPREPLPRGVTVKGKDAGKLLLQIDSDQLDEDRFVLVFLHERSNSPIMIGERTRLQVQIHRDMAQVTPKPRFTDGTHWTQELIDASVLEELVARTDFVRLGNSLVARSVADTGSKWWIWLRQGSGSDQFKKLLNPLTADHEIPLVPGRNRIALQVDDVLGRVLQDANPKGRAKRQIEQDGKRLVLVADFLHDPTLPRAGEVLVEHGRPAFIRVEFAQDFAVGTQISLTAPQVAAAKPQKLRAEIELGNACRFEVPFRDVSRWCSWDGVPRTEFMTKGVQERAFMLTTPAGVFRLFKLSFRPTASLLRSFDLSRGKAAWTPKIYMVPFQGPLGELSLGLRLPKGGKAPGSISLKSQVKVNGLEEFFLSSAEISRAAYLVFVDKITGLVPGPKRTVFLKKLVHHEDPLHIDRFKRENLLPVTTVFGNKSLEETVKADPERPVCGVNYFQAEAFARWLSLELYEDPDFFRLPFAAELVWAALHKFPASERLARFNGIKKPLPPAMTGRVDNAFRAFRKLSGDPRRWPPNKIELEKLGDSSPGINFGADNAEGKVYGIDFGLREWVEDLPLIPRSASFDLIRTIVSNHQGHVNLAMKRRNSEWAGRPENKSLGVIRGLGFGEPVLPGSRDPLLDRFFQDCKHPTRRANFGDSGLLGVRRAQHVDRGGAGLGKRGKHPLVSVTGFRLAGTSRFLAMARKEVR